MFQEGSSSSRKGKKKPVHFKGTRSLEGLKSRIDLAIKELHRLREENHHLHKELEAQRTRGQSDGGGATIVFSESAADLQTQLEKYLRVVDRYIKAEEAAEQEETE